MPLDPIAKHAEEVAKNALTHRVGSRFYAKVKGPELYVRHEIATAFRAPRHQLDFIRALRVAMLSYIQGHRKTCKNNPCGMDGLYEELTFILLDELELRTPEGVYTEDLSSAQVDRMEKIKTELLEAINSGFERSIENDLAVLGAVEEGFEELMKDRSTKTVNTGSMLKKYVEKIGERLAFTLVLDPVIKDISETLN